MQQYEDGESMERHQIAELCESDVLESAARLFGTTQASLRKCEDYEGAANLVYEFERGEGPSMLRVSYRPDRSVEQVQAELDFIEHLAAGGVRVSRPVSSTQGNLVEVIPAGGMRFIAAAFVKGRGMRVPDNDYRYRSGVPIEEYFQNWGQVLGQMHRLAKSYVPPSPTVRRPEWFGEAEFQRFACRERLPTIAEKHDELLAELQALPRDVESYGLIHNDFNDGNFTVDYDNGNITVFDFDDACYCWFMVDLAAAWSSGVGRIMFRPLEERKAFMDHYMDQVMTGYTRENTLSEAWWARLPLFLRLIQMQELVYYAQYLDDPDEEIQAGLRYKIHCIQHDIPYLGFFDEVYSPDRPFTLEPGTR
jgi:Ser/Thr protein kinase RdoA (MazF antagonist)